MVVARSATQPAAAASVDMLFGAKKPAAKKTAKKVVKKAAKKVAVKKAVRERSQTET